ncbi:transcription activator GAGA-like [Plodia interpunctella]|uniref:transcription activator GAGA-like n=1 Tax=Plodia interpunctella TaxID=58824 RepID=UPI002368A312|nr:transcription factor GAGA-like [Plodia interpunctella]
MAHSKVSLIWDAYKGNVCNGLSSLQQSGEFVDMTLAADGHFVKVHQIIMALASPFIKELISSIQCPHPVVFLNKISYKTLSLILEYIYTGEVMVSLENLTDLLVAGRELHIKGLEDMKIHDGITVKQSHKESENEAQDDEICYFEVSADQHSLEDNSVNSVILGDSLSYETKIGDNADDETHALQEMQVMEHTEVFGDINRPDNDVKPEVMNQKHQKMDSNVKVMQYTVSNQGSLQMILNRFVYYLKHTNRNSTRQWRCVDYVSHVKCPALVVTKEDMVIQRIAAHTHPFHDLKILKKVRRGAIFSALQDAEREGTKLKIKSVHAQGEKVDSMQIN